MANPERPGDRVVTLLNPVSQFPRVVRIEPASTCNLACSHCPTGTVAIPRGVMPANVFEEIIRQMRPRMEFVKVAVLYHGGEPLINRHLPDMIKAVKGLGVPFVKTVSNGMLLTKDIAARLIDSGLDSITFSMDGTSPEENDAIRRNARFITVLANVKALMDEKAARVAKTPRIDISTVQFVDPKAFKSDDVAPVPGYLSEAFAGPYAPGAGLQAFKTTFAMRWPHMNVGPEYELFEDPAAPDNLTDCDYAENTMTIRWNGDVVPCCYDLTSRAVLGNVMTQDAGAIWNGEKYRAFREGIHMAKYPDLCETCNTVRRPVYLVRKPA